MLRLAGLPTSERLLEAYSQFEDDELAKLFAAAFLQQPCAPL